MRNREPRLTVRALRPLMSGLMTLGYDPVPFLDTQGIHNELLLDPDATVPMRQAGNVTAQGLAARLTVSVRTVHRSLAAEGTPYRRLLDQLPLDIAERHLMDDRMSVAEVAFLVGFSEISAFHRAFKRWTGRTPVTFRAEARIRPDSRSDHA